MSEATNSFQAKRRRFRRYPKYKDSGIEWLGEVPALWDAKKLGWITECLDGRRVPLNAEQRGTLQGEYPYWGANTIVDYIDDWLFDEELVLLGEDGAPFFDRNKPVAFHVRGRIWVNNHTHVLRPRGSMNAAFLTHALNCVDYHAFIGGSTRDKLTQGEMNGIIIQCPTFAEQKNIAAFLDCETAKIDALIGKKERLIKLLQEKRKALITQAITKGLDPTVPMKDSGVEWIDQIPEYWIGLSLKRWVKIKITDGPHETPALEDEGVDFISAEAVSNGKIDFDHRRGFISQALHELYCRKCKPVRGDILLCKSGATTGKLAMVEVNFDFSVWSPLALIRAEETTILPKFLALALESNYVQEQIMRTWSAGTQPNPDFRQYPAAHL